MESGVGVPHGISRFDVEFCPSNCAFQERTNPINVADDIPKSFDRDIRRHRRPVPPRLDAQAAGAGCDARQLRLGGRLPVLSLLHLRLESGMSRLGRHQRKFTRLTYTANRRSAQCGFVAATAAWVPAFSTSATLVKNSPTFFGTTSLFWDNVTRWLGHGSRTTILINYATRWQRETGIGEHRRYGSACLFRLRANGVFVHRP